MGRLCLAVVFALFAGGGGGATQGPDPLAGAWEVIYGWYGTPDGPLELSCADRPVQLKVFGSSRFAYVRHNEDGSFLAASAGSYSIDGSRYTETTLWSSVPEAVGTRVTFEWVVVGDTLCFRGPIDVVDGQRNRVEDVPRMRELMRRAGSRTTNRTACE